jgi:16S rRNA (adenine1518-N6/adenine1519-N6)-dimethyltransferase
VPSGATDRPTKERDWLVAHGIHPAKRLGQNFLLDQKVPSEIVTRASWTKGARVLEVGPGGGALTRALLAGGHPLLAVELDPALVTLLQARFAEEIAAGHLILTQQDFLRMDLTEAFQGDAPLWLAGNLPYGVTTPMVLKALAHRDRLSGAVLMVQREYGERLTARAGQEAYSSLSVWIAAHAVARPLMRVGRSAFWPRPGVESMVVELVFPAVPPFPGIFPHLERVLRAAFGQRRKTLENALSHGLPLPKEEARRALLAAGIDPSTRAETLSLDRFTALAAQLPEVPCGTL